MAGPYFESTSHDDNTLYLRCTYSRFTHFLGSAAFLVILFIVSFDREKPSIGEVIFGFVVRILVTVVVSFVTSA
jgi:hypothetical protein